MPHSKSKAAEDILDQEFPILDHGFIRLVDYMGSDDRVVAAARVSYGAGTKTVREDEKLIRYLMKNQHTSPFEQVVMTFHAKMPIFVARQWVRHRTARLNEMSGRYSVMENEFYIPDIDTLRTQSTVNKQGRSEEKLSEYDAMKIIEKMTASNEAAYKKYETMLDMGLAREVARTVLPLSLYTQWYWQIDLHNLFHFLKLRLHPHAQYEIRQYAKEMGNIASKVAPMSYSAFVEYVLGVE